MKSLYLLPLLAAGVAGRPAAAQSLTNSGSVVALIGGAVLYVGGPVTNLAAGTLNLGDGTLYVGGDLVNAGTLVPGTGTVRLVGTAPQALDLGGPAPTGVGPTPAMLHNLTISNTAGGVAVMVPSNVGIGNLLTLSGGQVLTAPAATITLLARAVVTGETSARYVAGNLRSERSAVAGSSFVDFTNGFRLNPGGQALGDVAVVRSAGLLLANVSYGVNPADASKKGIDQVWRVVPATQPTTAPTTVELTWLAANDNGLVNFASARLWQRRGGPWTTTGPTTNASSRTLAHAVTGPLDQLTVSAAAAPLPVTLVSFEAVRRGDAALLRWRTASETNNDYFGVEVSPDGRTFRPLARVAGQGTTATATDYELRDPALFGYGTPLVYYRLRQIDLDGTATYSPVRAVAVPAPAFAAYPNPVRAGQTLLVVGATGPVQVFDALGRLVLRTAASAGVPASVALPPGLATGVYVLRSDSQAVRLVVE